jgi:Flp pilus assembly protein TadD
LKKILLFLSVLLLLLLNAAQAQPRETRGQPLMVYRLDPYLFDPGIYNNLATRKGVENTLKTLQDKVAADPKDFAAMSDLGSVHFLQARYRDAAQAYEKSIELAPQPDKKVYYNLGTAYFAQGLYNEAQLAFRFRAEIEPKDNWSWALLGVTLMMRKDYAAAQGCLEKALALDPEMDSARINLGGVYYFKDKKDLAQKEYAAVAKSGSWPQAHYNLALIYKEQSKNEEAARELEIYLAQYPEAPDYRVILKEIERLRK